MIRKNKTLLIKLTTWEHTESGQLLSYQLTIKESGHTINLHNLWYEFSYLPESYDANCLDSILVATIMYAMELDADIELQGCVSKSLLDNLTEFIKAWHCFAPKQFKIINIFPNQVVTDNSSNLNDESILAFSGGLDATYSLWQHSKSNSAYYIHKVKIGVLVQGFDISLTENNAFSLAKETASNVLSDVNAKLVTVKTNYRDVIHTDWMMTFAPAVIAVLMHFNKEASYAILGSSEPYNKLVLPWGSSPVTDHLLSKNAFKTLHDGASLTRIDKIDAISDWKIAVNNLRVCYDVNNNSSFINCGKCEKCIRTILAFIILNKPIPDCFEHFPTKRDIMLQGINDPYSPIFNEWKILLDVSKEKNVKNPIFKIVEKKLKKTEFEYRFKVINKKKKIKSILDKFGMLQFCIKTIRFLKKQ